MGGISSEHDVSMNSGAMVAGSLDRAKYEVTPVIIAQNGTWKFPGEQPRPIVEALPRLQLVEPDCVFLALHGPFGEDGRLQGMLDLLGIPYVGAGCAASALAIDKIRSKALVAQAGIRVAKQVVLERGFWDSDPDTVLKRVKKELGFPCVIKSPCQGSSIGMAIPKNPQEFRDGLLEVLSFDQVVLIEEFLSGTEVTCSVLDIEPGAKPRALPVTEISPISSAFFDYYAKYTAGACEEITPARISETATQNVQEMAVRVHELVGCRGLSRSDMILEGDDPVWIEINTIPGMTETSLFPQAAAAVGISFPEVIEMLVEAAISWERRKDS
jgi:D-alanine-D-alanine ligase